MSFARQLLETYYESCYSGEYDYPDVTNREYYADGSLKGGFYKGIRVEISHKEDCNAPRTHTSFDSGEPILIYINSRQAINPAFSWYHEIAHIEEPGGRGPDPKRAEFVADRFAIRKTGMSKSAYKDWLLMSDRSRDSIAHVKARLDLCNNFKKYIE